MNVDKPPQQGPQDLNIYNSSPGAFRQLWSLQRSILDPGDRLRAALLISGHGYIQSAKILISSPHSVFDKSDSNIFSGFQLADSGGIVQGTSWTPYRCEGMLHFTAEVTLKYETESICFGVFSPHPGNQAEVLSEQFNPAPPVTLNLKIFPKCRPGDYRISTVFTYHNGHHWISEPSEIVFTVRSILQRHDFLISLLALTAALATIASAGISFFALYLKIPGV